MPEAVGEPATPAATAPLQPGRGDQTGLFAVLVPACHSNCRTAGPDRYSPVPQDNRLVQRIIY